MTANNTNKITDEIINEANALLKGDSSGDEALPPHPETKAEIAEPNYTEHHTVKGKDLNDDTPPEDYFD